MCIEIRLPVISSFSLRLSRGFYAIFSVPFPSSDHFPVMCVIDYAIVKCSEAQFRSRYSDLATPPSRSTPSRFASSTSAPLFSSGDVTLGDIMAQSQRMDARFDTLFTELY